MGEFELSLFMTAKLAFDPTWARIPRSRHDMLVSKMYCVQQPLSNDIDLGFEFLFRVVNDCELHKILLCCGK